MAKFWRAFDIDIIKLNEGTHEFPFDIEDEFFEHFKDNDIVKKGNLKATILLRKEVNLLEATFIIDGTVKLTCDRSLEEFDQALYTEEKIIYKYGSEEQEINEEIIMITRDTPKINVAQLIYEFIILALPVKKIHPDYRDEEEMEGEGKLVYWSDDINEEEEDATSEPDSDDQIDPRWEALKNIKKKD
ncbi:DUF177 domain-containing protein [Echinicola strongylocentroti]|uniref:DUF177 domain-containing protein n=1 Tax=Echinicola strongylocentroti TaxID=1795355 RepID=A0A2Z4IGZ3_9BACT|nr:DUF177 domain-containing protein [Echinicola strongylocentroti]AWW29977.1 DUF177 domain-containing protein [Echinicola strongylocentroti]